MYAKKALQKIVTFCYLQDAPLRGTAGQDTAQIHARQSDLPPNPFSMAPVAVQNTANGGLKEVYPSGVDDVVKKTHMPVGLEKSVPNPGVIRQVMSSSDRVHLPMFANKCVAWHALKGIAALYRQATSKHSAKLREYAARHYWKADNFAGGICHKKIKGLLGLLGFLEGQREMGCLQDL